VKSYDGVPVPGRGFDFEVALEEGGGELAATGAVGIEMVGLREPPPN
jgi:hypothetical protein